MSQALTIRVEEFLPHPVAKVWRALTDAELLARWLMLNDFKLELGHRFTFQTAPLPAVGLDGVIHCEVLTIEPLHLLWLSWRGGRGLDSILTWRLEPENAGTRLIVEHTGFDPHDPAQRLAHLVTLNADGSPQVTCVWVGIEDDELVTAHLGAYQKVRNVGRDPRVALSLETGRIGPGGLPEYLVVYGRARVVEGGAPGLLQRLAKVYIGPDVKFPPMDNPPPGFVLHISPERISGHGRWGDETG